MPQPHGSSRLARTLGERLDPFFGETTDAVIARLAARWPDSGLRARVAVGQEIQTGQKQQHGSAGIPTTGRTGITEDGPGRKRPSLTPGGFGAAVDVFSGARPPKSDVPGLQFGALKPNAPRQV
jgi:hypothetical protein